MPSSRAGAGAWGLLAKVSRARRFPASLRGRSRDTGTAGEGRGRRPDLLAGAPSPVIAAASRAREILDTARRVLADPASRAHYDETVGIRRRGGGLAPPASFPSQPSPSMDLIERAAYRHSGRFFLKNEDICTDVCGRKPVLIPGETATE